MKFAASMRDNPYHCLMNICYDLGPFPREKRIGNSFRGRILDFGRIRRGRGVSSRSLVAAIMLILGILYHVRLLLDLGSRRGRMKFHDPVRGQGNVPVSLMVIVAMLLLIVSLLAAADMQSGVGPLAQ
jgi:hypothetical protein